MTIGRLTRFERPFDVAQNRVGKKAGCYVYNAKDRAMIPALAKPTNIGNSIPGFSASITHSMTTPDKKDMKLNILNTVFALMYARSTPPIMHAGMSAPYMAAVLTAKLPGKYFICKLSM